MIRRIIDSSESADAIETGETMPLRNSDDVVRVRQAVRARAIAAGFSLVDQTKIVTAASEVGAQYRRLRRRRHAADRAAAGRAADGGAPDLHRSGARHRRHRKSDDGWLHHRRWFGSRPQRRQAPVERIRHHIYAGQRHRGDPRALEGDMITAVTDASQVAEARRLVSGCARNRVCRRRAWGRWRSLSPNWRPTC